MFGSLLRKSRFVKDVGWDEVMQIASGAVDRSEYSQKEFLELVKRAQEIYTTKKWWKKKRR